MKSKIIYVMLVEDHPEYREVIKLAVEKESDIELSVQVGSAERALSILENAKSDHLPDLILLDLNLPGIGGLVALPSICSIAPESKIIILTQSGKEADVIEAIQNGASGYLLKSSTAKQVVEAIRIVAKGGALLDHGVAKFVLDTLRSRPLNRDLKDALSPRELEILTLLGKGLAKKEVATNLSISINTVATHIRRVYEKLDVQNAPAAITKAFQSGLFPRDDD